MAAAVRRPDQTAVYFQELRWLEQLLPVDMVTILRERQHKFRQRVCDIVDDGIAQGLFRPLDPTVAVEAVVSMARWALRNSITDVADAAEQCAQFVINGIRSQPCTTEETR